MFGTIKKDMQLTLREFASRLPSALAGFEWNETQGGYRAQRCGTSVDISIRELDARKIGAIVLPRCEVSFTFDGFSEEEQGQFLRSFERVYQKGGG